MNERNQEPDETPAHDALLDLSGHRVLVTGGSGNIGAGIARRLAAAGAAVLIHYCANEQAANELEAELEGRGATASCVQGDLSSPDGARRLFASLDERGDRVDLLVNNAAVQPAQELAAMTIGDWRELMAANLDSAFAVTAEMVSRLRRSGRAGAIVNIASIEGSDPAVGHGHYATSKAGMLMFTRACALEYAAFGIRVNAVSPGLIDRPGLADEWPQGLGRWRSKAPLERPGLPDDVANAVLFLLSPAARWISGANLVVDGGMSAAPRW